MANAKTNWMKDASGTIFIPKLKPTGTTNKPIYISTNGDITECGPIESVKSNLSFGTKTYNGSIPQTITAADLGIIGAMVYKGTSSTEITDGGTQAPKIGSTTIAIADLKPGNVVLYGQKEFVWNGSKWELLGDEGSYKVKQDAVTTPGASGNSSAFIDTITQDANGKIAVTKKNVDFTAINTDLTTLKNKTQHITANADETYFAKDVKVADELITDKIKTTQAFYHFIDGSNKAIATIDANGVTSTSFNGALNGNANTATKLATARTIQTNLASTSSASFDGSGNVTPGVSGVLGIANGGTGNSAGYIRTGQKAGSTIGNYATAEGSNTEASGDASHAEGSYTEASGNYSHAEGSYTEASGNYSHAEGYYTEASGNYSHAEGSYHQQRYVARNKDGGYRLYIDRKNLEASGNYSHAEGYATKASGKGAHAEGISRAFFDGTITSHDGSNEVSIKRTWQVTASGDGAHAEGISTCADGIGSHAEGYVTTAAGNYQHVQGKVNKIDGEDKYAHIVGNGNVININDVDVEEPSNAYTLDWEGNAWYQGGIKTGGNDYDEAEHTVVGYKVTNDTIKISDIGDEWIEIQHQLDGVDITFSDIIFLEDNIMITDTSICLDGEILNNNGNIIWNHYTKYTIDDVKNAFNNDIDLPSYCSTPTSLTNANIGYCKDNNGEFLVLGLFFKGWFIEIFIGDNEQYEIYAWGNACPSVWPEGYWDKDVTNATLINTYKNYQFQLSNTGQDAYVSNSNVNFLLSGSKNGFLVHCFDDNFPKTLVGLSKVGNKYCAITSNGKSYIYDLPSEYNYLSDLCLKYIISNWETTGKLNGWSHWASLTSFKNLFIACEKQHNGIIQTSTDGINWSEDINVNTAQSEYYFIKTSASGDKIIIYEPSGDKNTYISNDGINIEKSTEGLLDEFYLDKDTLIKITKTSSHYTENKYETKPIKHLYDTITQEEIKLSDLMFMNESNNSAVSIAIIQHNQNSSAHPDILSSIAELKTTSDEKVSKAGDTMTGALTIDRSNGTLGITQLFKHNAGSVDYGTQVRDEDKDGNVSALVIRATSQKALFFPDGSTSKEIIHTGNKNLITPEDIGAVNKSGDTMTGNLTIEKAEAPTFQGVNTTTGRDIYMVSTSDNYATVANRIAGDQNNRVALWLAPETETDDKLLRIRKEINGTENTYKVYHEGNKPTPADIGAATQIEVDELKTSVSEGKALIAAAVTDKGVETAATDTFAVMASNIESIETGSKIISGTFKTKEFFGSESFTTTDFNKINAYKNFILVKASEDDRSETPYDGYYYTVRNVIALFKIDNSFYAHTIGTTVSGAGDAKPYSFYEEITLSLSNRQDVYINKGLGNRNYSFRPGSYRYIAWN